MMVLAGLSLVLGAAACANTPEDDAPKPSLEEMIGQMLMVGFRGLTPEDAGREGIIEDIRQRHLGGIILFDYDVPLGQRVRNVASPEQLHDLVRALQNEAAHPLFVAIDQEGGQVSRLKPQFGFPEIPGHAELGRMDEPDSTRYYAEKTGQMLAEAGININFAPVVDVNVNPENPIIGRLGRSFSADPQQVIQHARMYLEGLADFGVWGVIKHFPGHGSAWNDSHHGMADVTGLWQETELKPYKELLSTPADSGRETKAEMLMSAHIFNEAWNPDHPATLAPEIMTTLLRDTLQYDGLVFSDDMQMGAIADFYGLEEALVRGINAGIDVLVFPNNSVYEPDIAQRAIAIIIRNIEDGNISRATIEQAYARIMKYKAGLL
ncbi:MAG: glycoside hydrolase family 3 protein [Cyclonatronaceae bacterium]